MDWYAVNTRPHKEELAEQNLRRLGVETLAPRLRQEKVIRRRRQTVVGPLFPGYLFARFDLARHLRGVSYARGVRKVVAFGAVPTPVDEAIIESIRVRLDDGCVTVPRAQFAPGQPVRILDGPLGGLEAIFERELSDRQRVILLLKALSYQARVVVALEGVAAL